MKLTGGAIVVRALEDEGIDLSFGIPGTHNIELYDALAESETVRTVLVTDEQSASFMADGAWRATGRMACVNVVSGAGLTHAMSGIAEAFMDHVPMLVLGCGIRRDLRKAFQLHDVDQEAMVRPVVKGTFRPEAGPELYGTIREACRLARSGGSWAEGVFPEEHPLFLWPGFGHTAPKFTRRIADQCDLTIAVGCRFSEVGTGSYALEPKGKLVHIDIDPDALDRNFPAEVAIAADAKAALRALLDLIGGEPRVRDEARRERIRTGHADVWEDWLSDVGGERVTPAHLLRTTQRVFGPDAVYTTDSGNGTFLAMECLRLATPRKYLAPVDYSCMGYSVPAALGAKLAKPDVPVVALAGDGAFLMTGLELLTAVQEGIGAIVLVLRDGELAQISQFQSTAMNRKVASAVHDYELQHFAAAMHAPYLRIRGDDMVEATLLEADQVARSGQPVLVEVDIDYARKTFFTKGVVKANLHRLPLRDRVRFIGRAVRRKFTE